MATINTVTKSRKPLTCRICRVDLPKGSAYTWVAHYGRPKMVHCPSCAWKRSELSGSDKVQRAWEAIETFQAEIADWDGQSWDELTDFASTCQSELEEVASEYEEACDAFENGCPPADLEERRDAMQDAACSADIDDSGACDWGDEETQCDEHGDPLPRQGGAFDSWLESTRDTLVSHFDGILEL